VRTSKRPMNTYICKFTGRTIGAIGITYPITRIVEAADESAATSRLYGEFEHIHNLRIVSGWSVRKASLYDEEGIEGWLWTSPSGEEFAATGDWDEPPVIPDDMRKLIFHAPGRSAP
jgi:hypothetical protein